MKNRYVFMLCFLMLCCRGELDPDKQSNKSFVQEVEFVINNEYLKGDVRRYGLFPDKPVGNHPKSKKNSLETILDIAESGVEIIFPKGHYKTNLLIKGRERIKLKFEDASFSGQIQIIQGADSLPSNNIQLLGKITSYSKFFSRFSQNIIIDTLILASDTLKNSYGKRNLGCNIYAATKQLSIKKLVVKDLGSGDPYYQYSAAALQIHGWNNNPENIVIDEVLIEQSDKHGVYITGSNHSIKKMTVMKYGLGRNLGKYGLEDAFIDEVNLFSGVWLNKCQSSTFNKITIDCSEAKGTYSINFDEGRSAEPTIIDYLYIKNNTNKLPMLPNDLTNIVVRHFNED